METPAKIAYRKAILQEKFHKLPEILCYVDELEKTVESLRFKRLTDALKYEEIIEKLKIKKSKTL